MLDLQTLIALMIVLFVGGRFVYKWFLKSKQKKLSSNNCGCHKDDLAK